MAGTIAPRPAGGEGRRFDAHVFICTEGPNCPVDGPAVEVLKFFKTQLKESPLAGHVRFNKAGCLDQCGHGPMMVVYPEGVWYAHIDMMSAQRIWNEHFLAGTVPEDLVYKTEAPGKNKLPMVPGGEPDTAHPAYKPCGRCPWGPPTA